MPFAWVIASGAKSYDAREGGRRGAQPGDVPNASSCRSPAKARIEAGQRFYPNQKEPKMDFRRPLGRRQGSLASPQLRPLGQTLPRRRKVRIDISLTQQNPGALRGKRAFYATLVSTGATGWRDPRKRSPISEGTFLSQANTHRCRDGLREENSSCWRGAAQQPVVQDESTMATIERLKKAKCFWKTWDEDDRRRLLNIEKGRNPEYGITVRRGAAGFELRDVPWIQYFASGYALHGAYWHDVFGVPRSHGCINLAPIDARIVFQWTDPPLPDGWHGINIGTDMGEGTTVVIRE